MNAREVVLARDASVLCWSGPRKFGRANVDNRVVGDRLYGLVSPIACALEEREIVGHRSLHQAIASSPSNSSTCGSRSLIGIRSEV
jgi:hypothetical protein